MVEHDQTDSTQHRNEQPKRHAALVVGIVVICWNPIGISKPARGSRSRRLVEHDQTDITQLRNEQPKWNASGVVVVADLSHKSCDRHEQAHWPSSGLVVEHDQTDSTQHRNEQPKRHAALVVGLDDQNDTAHFVEQFAERNAPGIVERVLVLADPQCEQQFIDRHVTFCLVLASCTDCFPSV